MDVASDGSDSQYWSQQQQQHQEILADNHDNLLSLCSNLQLIESKLGDWLVVISVILLVVINAMVIFGNILVILSVFVSQKLRTSTNYFIVSLAVADLLVGIAVIPYSLTLEVNCFRGRWKVSIVVQTVSSGSRIVQNTLLSPQE